MRAAIFCILLDAFVARCGMHVSGSAPRALNYENFLSCRQPICIAGSSAPGAEQPRLAA